MRSYEYKGFTIYPTPHLIGLPGCWTIDLVIKNNHVIRKISYQDFFASRIEALLQSLDYGRQLIDKGTVLISQA